MVDFLSLLGSKHKDLDNFGKYFCIMTISCTTEHWTWKPIEYTAQVSRYSCHCALSFYSKIRI